MWSSFPAFGTALLLAVMILASYTFAVSLSAGASGRVRTLQAARLGAYGTVAMIGVAVLCLAYAFVSHDFRLRYVAHYSDRSMPTYYLLTALWGGQDGSLLWWLFLLSIYIGACVKWLGHRWVALQPYVIATLMAVVMFFVVLMTFAANPFSTSVAGARPDGEGLNPLLQNFYMIIHPPSLYTGFVGCSVPFAFAVAALVTGRLDSEWIVASRKWTLFAWLFLGIGNTLGMLWAYEELGWGGYWAWDPVENAAFMPFLTASAFVHSVMIQERRGLLKVWNVFLIILTFFMTIFGTFLTRSGAIASVHSFAQSGIGTYFVYFLVVLFIFGLSLVLWRWPELRSLTPTTQLRWAALSAGWTAVLIAAPGIWVTTSKLPWPPAVKVLVGAFVVGAAVYAAVEVVYRRMTSELDLADVRPRMESVWSREFTFLLNNWALLGFLFFVLVATTFPMLSEALWDEKVTVGPPYYNAWVQPIGFVIYALMGIGTLFGWKKTSPRLLKRAFRAPLIATGTAVVLHVALGKTLGHPAVVWGDAIYGGLLGAGLRAFNAITPVLGIGLVVFNLTVIVQEFVSLYRSRSKSEDERKTLVGRIAGGVAIGIVLLVTGIRAQGTVANVALIGFGILLLGAIIALLVSLVTLPAPSRRRYGGYVVHAGIVVMLFGFTGRSWNIDKETSMKPGDRYEIGSYSMQFTGPRMEVDTTKRMVFADLRVTRSGKDLGTVSPAKFIYKKAAESPTTEVAMLHTLFDDLYVVVGQINPQTKLATFQLHVNPLVSWIWFGCLVLILGSIVCMWPELAPEESRVWAYARTAAATVASLSLGIVIAMLPAPALAQGSSSMSGTVEVHNDRERSLFNATRCMCGGCERLPLTSCACSEADDARKLIREKISAGWSDADILDWYRKEHGSDSLTIPPNRGGMQLIYAVPVVALIGGGAGVLLLARKWNKRGAPAPAAEKKAEKKKRDDYDDRLDAELRELDD